MTLGSVTRRLGALCWGEPNGRKFGERTRQRVARRCRRWEARQRGSAQVRRRPGIRGDHSLHVVHVCPGYGAHDLLPVAWAALQAEARAVLDRSAALAGDTAPGLEISSELAVGPPVAGVLAAGRGGRLMVVGRSPHHRVEAPGGGTPTALATRAACPVVIAPSTWRTPGPAPGRVVVAMKSRTHARELLSHAFALARDVDATVEVLTAWELYDPTMDREEARDHAAEWEAEGIRVLEDLVSDWRETFPTVPVDLRVIHGRAASVLEQASADVDLLLIARRQHFVPPYGRLGSTAHRVLRTSRCPVQVVPAGVIAEVPALVAGWVPRDLTLVPTDGASWPSRRTTPRDVLAVHHAQTPAQHRAGPTVRRTSWS